jgi:hypothetical protein
MALPYNVYAMEFLVLRVVYPRLLAADPRGASKTADAELASQGRRLARTRILAGLVPLASAAVMVAAGPEAASSNFAAFRLLVLALLALGGIGFVAALLLSANLHQALTALTGRQTPTSRQTSDGL